MSKDGTAKMMNRLLEQTKSDAKTIAELREQIAKADRHREISVNLAIKNTIKDERAKQDEMQKLHDAERDKAQKRHDADWAHAAQERDTIVNKLAETKKELAMANARIEELDTLLTATITRNGALEMELAAANKRLETIEPELRLIEIKRKELQQLNDKVRDRMRRREREEEAAILNRKAMPQLTSK